ncbi:uncharacterized protein LOC142889054 [Nelusetta ayraudi]|uniref:uncharacterized protein LOC142889054 n=1 Tax=Nelusetta ayraudi TaxID=303726 RepID=UPI003F6FDE3C
MKAPGIQITTKAKEGSPSKFKMPTFKLPKFGIGIPSASVEVSDLDKGEKIDKVKVDIPKEELTVDIKPPKIEMEVPSFQMKTIESEHEGKGSKFKMPSLGFGVPQVKKPDIDLSLSQKDVEVTVPEATAEVTLPDVKLKQPSADIEIKAPEMQITAKAKEASTSKFKMPTFRLPKFGTGTASASVEVPDLDKGEKIGKVDVNIPEEELTVEIKLPKIEMEAPSVQMKTIEGEHDGKESKFKMPSLGFGVPHVKTPGVDLSLSQKDIEVTVPEAKAEVTLPDVELKQPSADIEMKAPEIQITTKTIEAPPSKFKMPTFKLPRFGTGTPGLSVEVPDIDKSDKSGKAEVNIPEEELTVDIKPPKIDMEVPTIQMKTMKIEHEGKGSKFKMPSLGFGAPQVKKPDIDLSLSQKDVEVTVPQAKAEVTLPDVELKQPSADIKIKSPDIQITTKTKEGSPSKFKMPTFKLPKFGTGTPSASVEVPDLDKGEEIGKIEVNIPEEELTVDIKPPKIEMEAPPIQMKTIESEHEGKGSKFKMPGFGFSMPQVKKPDIDLSLPQKDVEVTIPEAKAEVTLPDIEMKQPSADIEIKTADIQITTKTKEGSPSKFKMPTFKLPKFGTGNPSASVEVSGLDKGEKIGKIEVNIPEEELTVDIKPPKIDMEVPSIQMKTIESENEGKGSKFKMPSLGFGVPQVKKPDIDLSLSQKNVEVTIPEAKAEVTLPDVELKQPSADIEMKAPDIQITTKTKEGSPSKFKMPTFKFPKFGTGTPSANVEVPDLDKGEKIGKIEVNIPEEELTVDIKLPKIDIEAPSIQMKTTDTEHEGKGSKFKMPSLGFGVPQVKKPDIDLSLSQKDVEATVPEAKAEVTLPDVELKQPSADIKIKSPDIQITTKTKEGSPSKFKMPTFRLPKFGTGTTTASVEVPHLDKGEKIGKVDVNIPEEELTVDIKPPKIDMEAPSIQIKAIESENEGKGSKFKMPSLGFGAPQVKKPDIDLSLSQKDVEVTVPEAKAEVTLPDVELKQPSADIEMKAPDIQITTKTKEGSPSKFKMPPFKLPKFGVGIGNITVKQDLDKGAKTDNSDIDIPDDVLTVDIQAPKADIESPKISLSKQSTKEATDFNVSLPEGKVEVEPTDYQIKKSKFSLPRFSLPRTAVKEPEVKAEMPHLDISLQDGEVKVKQPDVALNSSGHVEVDIQTKNFKKEFGISLDGSQLSATELSTNAGGLSVDAKGSDISMPKVQGLDLDLPSSKTNVDARAPENETEVKLPNVNDKEPEEAISVSNKPIVEVETKFKRPNWSFPKFSFTRSSAKVPDVNVNLETEAYDKSCDAEEELQVPDAQFQGTSVAVSAEESSVAELNANLPSGGINLPDSEANSKDAGGSPLKFKVPTMNMPQLGGDTFDVSVEGSDGKKRVEGQESELQGDFTLNIKGTSVEIKTDDSKPAITETELSKTETGTKGLGSPSKFKLPLFKMPKLSFSRTKAEEEKVSVETESKVDKTEINGEPKNESSSPKMTLTSFGDMLKNMDVEFDVSKSEKEEDYPDTSKGLNEGKPSEKQVEPQDQERNTKADATKSPAKTGGFKFLKFGFFSQSEPPKISDKHEPEDQKSPAEEKLDEEISPTCSIQSSDAFADISSTVTSEHVALSTSSPTKEIAKYSDSSDVPGFEELQSDRITSTTKTEVISVKPNMPEKITILSSGVSSSSEDTLKLESQKIHIITSNIQAAPEAQHAKLLTAIQVQPIGGLSLKSEIDEAASWTVEDSQPGSKIFERHLVRKTSSESKETILVTKQITHTSTFESSEPISGATASSIQRLRESVHSEKMRFFDGTEE